MRLYEIFNESSYADELRGAVIDVLTARIAREETEMSMEELLTELSDFQLTVGQAIAAVEETGYASSVNDETITFVGNIGSDFTPDSTADDLETITDREALSAINNK